MIHDATTDAGCPPAPVDPADQSLADAIVRYSVAVIEATKCEGTSVSRNLEERTALRLLLRACGYGQAHLRKRVEEYIVRRVG